MAVTGCLPVVNTMSANTFSKDSEADRGNNEAIKGNHCRDGLNALFKLASGNSSEAIVLREQMYEVCPSSFV